MRIKILVLVALAVGCLASTTSARLEPKTSADRTSISLSETLAVTLSLEGPAPLRIEPPPSWLSDDSANDWKIGPPGPAKVEPTPGGRGRRAVTFSVDPFVAGEAMPLQFASARVTAGSDVKAEMVSWPGLEIRVVTGLKDAKPADARPITGIEKLPAPPAVEAANSDRVATAFGLLLLAGLMLAVARRLNRREPETPAEKTLRELDGLLRQSLSEEARMDRLSFLARSFLEEQYGFPATRLTTAELIAASREVENLVEWQAVLERCDAIKFAGAAATAEEGRREIQTVRKLLERVNVGQVSNRTVLPRK